MSLIAGTNSIGRIFTGKRKDFIVMRKDTFEYTGTYEYVNESGVKALYDFTDCVGMMMIKKRKTDTEPVKVVNVRFNTTEYILSLDAQDMDMDAGRYYYDLQIYDADNKMVTKLYGNFTVLQDVTDFEGVVEPYLFIDLDNEITYTFDDFIHQANIIASANEITYTKDDFIYKTVTIFPDIEISAEIFEFLVFNSSINIKSEIVYTYDDFIYLPMKLLLNSEATYLPQYYLTGAVSIGSEIVYEILKS